MWHASGVSLSLSFKTPAVRARGYVCEHACGDRRLAFNLSGEEKMRGWGWRCMLQLRLFRKLDC